jgi:hypothetical protein
MFRAYRNGIDVLGDGVADFVPWLGLISKLGTSAGSGTQKQKEAEAAAVAAALKKQREEAEAARKRTMMLAIGGTVVAASVVGFAAYKFLK